MKTANKQEYNGPLPPKFSLMKYGEAKEKFPDSHLWGTWRAWGDSPEDPEPEPNTWVLLHGERPFTRGHKTPAAASYAAWRYQFMRDKPAQHQAIIAYANTHSAESK